MFITLIVIQTNLLSIGMQRRSPRNYGQWYPARYPLPQTTPLPQVNKNLQNVKFQNLNSKWNDRFDYDYDFDR